MPDPTPASPFDQVRTPTRYGPLELPELPRAPLGPAQRLAFWQAEARRHPFAPRTGQSLLAADRLARQRSALLHAAADLDTARVADLLDDPEVLAGLRHRAQAARQASGTFAGANPPPPRPPVILVLKPGAAPYEETPLEVVLYAVPVTGRAAGLHVWATDALRAQETLVALLLAAGDVPTASVWLATGFAANPQLLDRLVAAGHTPPPPPVPPLPPEQPAAWFENPLDVTPLHLAAAQGWPTTVDVIERLIAQGWPVDVHNRYGRTPLYTAVQNGQLASVSALLAHGATVHWPQEGDHALLLAAAEGWTDLIDPLRAAGASLDTPGVHGKTALALAARSGRTHTMGRLLDRGARITDDAMEELQGAIGREHRHPMGGPTSRKAQALCAMAVRLERTTLREVVRDAIETPPFAGPRPVAPTPRSGRPRERL